VHRTGSRPSQPAIADFATDQAFAQTRIKLQERYGFEIGESTIQRIVLGYARAMFDADRPSLDFPETSSRHKTIVAQTDGGMIPIVEPDVNQKDKRKGKKTSWGEAKISLAHAKGSRTPVYAKSAPERSKAAWKSPGGSFSNARLGPASARTPAYTRSATERLGSWAKWRSNSAPRVAT
jgi:hypothetical protein